MLLCETREQAERARHITAQALAPLGLSLSPEKPRVKHLDQGFDFLGWRYKGRQRWPRVRSEKAFRHKAKAKTRRNRPGSMEAICTELEPLLRGFFNYYRNGNSAGTFSSQETVRSPSASCHLQERPSAHPGTGIILLESRMRENRTSGSEGGAG